MQAQLSLVKKFKSLGGKRRRRTIQIDERKEDFIYFEDGVVTETLPGTNFKVKVKRGPDESGNQLPPIEIVCGLKAILIKRRVMIIKGDTVVVEVNPMDMYHDLDSNILKGTIIQRK